MLEQNVYRGRKITDTVAMKKAIIEEWDKIPQSTIVKCIDVFRERVRKTIDAEGGHIERYYNKKTSYICALCVYFY